MPSICRETDTNLVCAKVVKATPAMLSELIKKNKLQKLIPAILRYTDEGLPIVTVIP